LLNLKIPTANIIIIGDKLGSCPTKMRKKARMSPPHHSFTILY